MPKRRKPQMQRQQLQPEHRYYQTPTQQPSRRKKVRLRARFYTIMATFIMLIIGLIFWRSNNNSIPNLHGWDSSEVVRFANDHNINVEFEFSYSNTVAPTLVIGQSVAPGTNLNGVHELIVEVSKGIEVR